MKKNQLSPLILLIFLLTLLPLLLLAVFQIQEIRKGAVFLPANIVVDVNINLGPLPRPWEALAQGGEDLNRPMLTSAVKAIRALNPRYIRIDHLFNGYDLVATLNPNNTLTYNWSRLDQTVNDILKTGATPMLVLSYMPPLISSGDLVSPPKNWLLWQQLVKDIIEHYSGVKNLNLANVYYEVWNEPDLFGQWTFDTTNAASYLTLYHQSVLGAARAQNVLPFKIGGPAITDPGPTKIKLIKNFLDYVDQNNLRLDFVSWHRYHPETSVFIDDLDNFDRFLQTHPRYAATEIVLSEWGSYPENSPSHDSVFDAAHTLASIRQFLGRLSLAASFEIIDGKDPQGRTYWGRWGLLTHDSTGLMKKPRYHALLLLTKMRPQRIALTGEGSFITGFASRDQDSISVVLTNFDKNQTHSETFPLQIQNLSPGLYEVREHHLSSLFPTVQTFESRQELTASFFLKTLYLPPNSVFMLELDKI